MLKVNDLKVNYGQAQVIFGLSIEVADGQITSIIGPNGAGKSTLLNTIAGLLRQNSGEIVFNEEHLENLPTRERVAKGLVLCPERRRLFANLKVIENVMLGAYLRKDDKIASDLERVYELFPILKERKNQLAGTLSGGEQQFVAISRSLMSAPKLIMLDEPSIGLSPLMRERIFDAILKIRELSNLTVLIVEQDAVDALSIADRSLVLESGTITMQGNKNELMGNAHVKEAFLGL